jgi:hypothetical protein
MNLGNLKNYFLLVILLLTNCISISYGQKSSIKVSVYEGLINGGCVGNGAYLNTIGPNVSLNFKDSKIILGTLPSLRFQNDISITKTKNSFVTPSLGIGLTYQYKKLALQLPLYYVSKNTIENGK